MGVYDPTDEYDELEESSDISGIGEGRRKTLAAIDAKGQLDDPQSFGEIEEMKNAIREISLAHPDGRVHMAPPERPLDAIDAAYSDLPEEAQQEYLNDHRLYVKIRAARNRFNDWMGKKRREQEMPSPVEAGPANYPADKARKTAQYAREGKEELDEALDKITSAARGAKQRALESIGSSVAEHNEQKAQDKASRVKEQLEPGDIVFNRSTSYGLVPWGVKRLNDKSVRLKRPHQSAGMEKPMSDGETYPEYDLTTVDYDSDFLTPTDREEWREIDRDELPDQADVEEELTRGYEPAIRYLMGDEWVDENLELGETDTMSETNDSYDPTEEFQDDRPQQDQLVDESTRASSDTESRVDEGGSESFVDDRGDVYDPTEDTGEQSSLVSEEVEGQASLTGDQATTDPEYQSNTGPGAREKALDRIAEGSWHPGVISRGFDVPGSVASTIEEMGDGPSHVLKVDENLDDLTEYPGIGESSAAQIRETIPLLESRGVSRHDHMAEDGDDGGRNEWAVAVEYVREHYGDDYQDRIEFSSDIGDLSEEEGIPPHPAFGSEGVTQPLLRYQEIPPTDVYEQIENKIGEDDAKDVQKGLVAFAREDGARSDDGADEGADLLPTTPRGRRKKGEREGFDEIGPFQAIYDNRGLVKYHIPGEKEDGPRMALRFNNQDDIWKAQVSEEGWARPSGMQTVGTGTLDEAVEYLENVAGPLAQEAGSDAGDGDPYDPIDEWGPTSRRPISDVWQDLTSPREESLQEEQDYEISPSGRYRADETEVTAEEEAREAGLDPESVYDPTEEPERRASRKYRLDLDPDVEDVATTALGLLRKDYHRDKAEQGDVDEYDFSRGDVSEVIKRLNINVGEVGFSEGEMDVLWAATSKYATEQGNTRDLGRLEDAMAEAENAAEEDDMSTDTGDVYDPTEEQGGQIEDVDHDGGQVVVGERDLDVPAAWDGWHELHFIADSIEPSEDRGTEAVYLGPDRRYSAVVEGTAVSNKWGITAYSHEEPIPKGADYLEMRYGPGGADSESESWKITHGNTADSSAAAMLEADLPRLDGVKRHFDGGEDPDVDDQDDEPTGRAETVDFGTLDAANEAREEYEKWLHPSDHRSYKSVKFDPDTPRDVMDQIGEDATASQADETKTYPQAQLSDDERAKLDRMYDNWKWGRYGFGAMSAKGALQAEGVTDWMNYYEPGEGRSGALSTLESGKETAAMTGAKTATTGEHMEKEMDAGEIAREVDKAQGEACDNAQEWVERDGDREAVEFLVEECGWTREEVDRLLETAQELGEQPAEIYDPTVDTDSGQAFEEWAREAEPEPPSEPDADEMAHFAPSPDELTGPALRALKKAWTGYKTARADARQGFEDAERYAEVINGIRAVHGQDPIDFDELDWEGGEVFPDEPGETYPAPEGGQETLAEAIKHGHAAGAAQVVLSEFSAVASDAPYDPTKEL